MPKESANDIHYIYSRIESLDSQMFFKLKKQLVKEGWVA